MPDLFLALGEFADSLAKLLEGLQAQRDRRHKRAAGYFKNLGETLQTMTVILRRKEIPRVEGTKFNTLVAGFDKATASLAKTEQLIKAHEGVRKAAYVAKRLDWHLLVEDPQVAKSAERWLKDMERAAGLLQAIAVLLDTAA